MRRSDARRTRRIGPGQSRITDDLPRGIGITLLRLRAWCEALFWVALIGFAVILATAIGYIALNGSIRQLSATSLWTVSWILTDAFLIDVGQWTVHTTAGPQRWTTGMVRNDPWHIAQAALLWSLVVDALRWGVWLCVPACLLTVWTARHAGRKIRDQTHVRGRQIVPATQLEALVQRGKPGPDPDLRIGRIPFIKGSETQHALFIGTTGAGKTTAIMRVMDAARARGDAAVVYDVTGTLVERCYRPDYGDQILNPLDARSPPWSPWAEIRHPADADRVAASLIPLDGGSNAFFSHAARALFATALVRMQDTPDRSLFKLLDFLLTGSREEKERFFAGTEAAKYFAEKADRAGASVDMNAATFIRSLRYLPATSGSAGDFSVANFMASVDARFAPHDLGRSIITRLPPSRRAHLAARRAARPPWLFLTGGGTEHEALKPLVTCWVDSAIAALMAKGPQHERRVWFFLDELFSLHEIPSLARALAEGRKFGLCAVAGLQDTGQLNSIYGKDLARSMLSLLNTKVVFRVNDPDSARWVSDLLGQTEREAAEENARYGMMDALEGLNISTRRATDPLVLGAEVITLRDLECLVLLPGDWPIARVRIDPPTKDKRPILAKARETADLEGTVEAMLRHKAVGAPPGAGTTTAPTVPPHATPQPANAATAPPGAVGASETAPSDEGPPPPAAPPAQAAASPAATPTPAPVPSASVPQNPPAPITAAASPPAATPDADPPSHLVPESCSAEAQTDNVLLRADHDPAPPPAPSSGAIRPGLFAGLRLKRAGSMGAALGPRPTAAPPPPAAEPANNSSRRKPNF